VLVAVDGELIYHRAAGYADREAERPMREDTICRLASVTKTIVSATALALIDANRLAFDVPITEWLPTFRPKLLDGREPIITVNHLLSHTAGLDYGFQPNAQYRTANISTGLDMPGLSMDEALQRLASVPLLFEPGTAWKYSLATDVLGAVIARAGGAPLPDIVRDLVTAPLNMIDTDFYVSDINHVAVPYADGMPRPLRMNDPHVVPTPGGVLRFSPSRLFDRQSYPSGGAGMVGTAKDFLALLESIRRGGAPILSARSARALATKALPDGIAYVEPGWSFSLGAAVLCDLATARTPHDLGTWRWGGAYGNDWFVNPTRKLSVVSFSNTSYEGDGGVYPIDIRDAVYYALTGDA
jgi:CubicO group peptidase (beta-lactamase class C family)